MEWKIGEIRQIDGEWYQCIESHFSCEGCDFKNTSRCSHEGSECLYPIRQDRTSVIFKKLEKIGGPYDDCGTILQRFKIYTNVTNADTKGLELHIYSNDTIGIQIKQDKKEDMDIHKVTMSIDDRDYLLDKLESILHDTHCQQYKDEICEAFSKYIATESVSDLKPFDLEAAKLGKPVCTRDGRKARIVCFDKADERPIVALISDNKSEFVYEYLIDGRCYKSRDDDNDLMMLTEKKEGWINVYDNRCYNTKEEAMENKDPYAYYMTTVKVSWEE